MRSLDYKSLDLFRGRIVVYPFLKVDQARVDAGNSQAATVIRAKGHDADLRKENSISCFQVHIYRNLTWENMPFSWMKSGAPPKP